MRHAAVRLAALALAAALAGPAEAQSAPPVSAADPDSIVAALQALGHPATLETDPTGDPMIRSAAEGVDHTILFYLCEDGADCGVIQFRAGFDMPLGATSRTINDWNASRLFGQAFLDEEDDPFVQMAVDLRRPIDRDAFAAHHEWWRIVLADFRRHIGW